MDGLQRPDQLSFLQAVMEQQHQVLCKTQTDLRLPRAIQTNQHSIRFPVIIDDVSVRFAIVSEGRDTSRRRTVGDRLWMIGVSLKG